MRKAFLAFARELIDYAGLFPPARLDLPEAIHNYARYLDEDEGWMLGRFICPARRLTELAAYVEKLFGSGRACRLSILTRGGDDARSYLDGLGEDLREIGEFKTRHGDRVTIEMLESRLPGTLFRENSEGGLPDILEEITSLVARGGFPQTRVYFEIPPSEDWRRHLPDAIHAVATVHEAVRGFKIRCGGEDPSAFPPSELVAAAIAHCRDACVPLKATAGLHHPIRHFNVSVGARMHGFINLFGAGLLASVHSLDETTIGMILEEEVASSFRFDNDTFSWNDISIWTERIEDLRRTAWTSYGSCSFDEPRDDLRELRLLG
jgi:hypothetical protein